jgi:glycosyltransferase involved in cell wall biosynthesis
MPGRVTKISVLMPTYNCGKYIAQSVKSILSQTYSDFELIIIDDGSADNTESIIKDFKDKRIKYFKTEHNGTASALNTGVSKASGEWIARIDADDLNVPERLEKQVQFLNENIEYNTISSWSVYFNNKGKILFPLRELIEHNDIYEYLSLHNPLNQSGLIIQKELLLKNKFNEEFTKYEDFELMFRIRDEAKFYNIPEFLVYTRLRDNSNTNEMNDEQMYDVLYNYSFKNLISAKSKGRSFYWATNIAWINYFYGNKKDARKYLYNSFSWKNILAYLLTFLPRGLFNRFINGRWRYRLSALFENKSDFRKQLLSLLK